MESELQDDLFQVLEGLDPVEFLLDDPNLVEVAEEVLNCPDDPTNLIHGKVNEITDTCVSLTNTSSCKHNSSGATEALDSSSCCSLKTLHNSQSKQHRVKTPCTVCDGPSEGHNYYGAVACNSCRSFFFRSFKDDKHKTFFCKGDDINQQCPVDFGTPMSCEKCRFQKCLAKGMKIPEEYANEFTKSVAFIETLRFAMVLCSHLTDDDMSFIRDITIKKMDVRFKLRTRYVTRDLDMFKQSLELIYEGKSVALKSFKTWEDFLVYGQVQAFVGGELAVDHMTKRDRVQLLTKNFPLVNEFFEAYMIKEYQLNFHLLCIYMAKMLMGIEPAQRPYFAAIHDEVCQNRLPQAEHIR